MNYELLLELTRDIPNGLDRSKKKTPVSKGARIAAALRDQKSCQICGIKGEYGNPGFDIPGKLAIHHILPNGEGEPDNIITLCRYCHNAVHALLYAAGKWRYVPMR